MCRSSFPALCASVLILFASPSFSSSFVLVTAAEAEREQGLEIAIKGTKRKPVPGAPTIKLVSPIIGGGPVKAPVDIELVFEASEQAEVLRESIRVYYGFWRVDVTERILGEAEFTDFGLLAKNAEVPIGEHKLIISVIDSLDREGQQIFEFEVK